MVVFYFFSINSIHQNDIYESVSSSLPSFDANLYNNSDKHKQQKKFLVNNKTDRDWSARDKIDIFFIISSKYFLH